MKQLDKFAVFSPTIGSRSETFIKRHVTELLPEKTVTVCTRELTDELKEWDGLGVVLDISKIPPMSWNVRVERGFKRCLGYQLDEYSQEFVKKYLVANNVRVMLCEYLDYSIQWIDMAEELGIRMYAHAHGYDVSIKLKDPYWIDEYRKLNRIDGVITMSSFSKQRLIEIGINESLISVIPYGIPLPFEKPEYLPKRHIRCLAVGRMTGKKAPIYLLEAFRRALKNFPNMSLDYVGDGELMPAVVQFVDAFDMTEKVMLHGSQPNTFVYELMRKSDVFLQHSIRNPVNGDEEGLPVAIIEAMGHGLAVVATHHSGIPESVEDGVTGYLVPEGDMEMMSEKIIDFAQDLSKRETFGKAGRMKIEEKFTWDTERNNLLQLMNLK